MTSLPPRITDTIPSLAAEVLLVLAWIVVGGRTLRHVATRIAPPAARVLGNSLGQ